MAKFLFVEWLLLWLLESEQFLFIWDIGNLTKSVSKHSVVPQEVEESFNNRLSMPLGVQVKPAHNEERLGIVGQTDAGRMVMVAFTIREGKVRPISSRPASSKERKIYESYRREIS